MLKTILSKLPFAFSSVKEIDSLPNPVMKLDEIRLKKSLLVPVMLVTTEALITPIVLLSRALRSLALIFESVRDIASSPNPEIPFDSYAIFISLADPVIVVTVEASIVPPVKLSKSLSFEAEIFASLRMISSLPNPENLFKP